jgi:hypothetical protein
VQNFFVDLEARGIIASDWFPDGLKVLVTWMHSISDIKSNVATVYVVDKRKLMLFRGSHQLHGHELLCDVLASTHGRFGISIVQDRKTFF